MSTAYVDIVDARIDADSPGETGLMTDIRNDLRHLKERLDAGGTFSNANIYDDFVGTALDTDDWMTGTAAGGTANLDQQPNHALRFNQDNAQSIVLAATTKRMRFDLDRDHHVVMEARHKSGQADSTQQWVIGFQDSALSETTTAAVTDVSDCIIFRQDAVADKYDGYVSKAGTSLVVANSQGNAAAWSLLKIEITFIGATKKVEFFIDGTSVGSTTDTTKIPIVELRPLIGFYTGGGSRNQYIDKADFFWVERPLST